MPNHPKSPRPLVEFEIFRRFPEITAFATCRGDGFSLSRNHPENRKILAEYLNVPVESLVFLNQLHSDAVYHATGPVESPPDADASATLEKGTALCGLSADCPIVLIYDSKTGAIAAAHSGWRGTAKRIAPKTVEFMAEHFNTHPADLIAAVGPGICGACYKVSSDAAEAALASCPGAESCVTPADGGKFFLDLKPLIQKQLLFAGLKPENIEVSPYCTSCRTDMFFSHRRENPERGQCAAVILRK
jgi:hypothetical protein